MILYSSSRFSAVSLIRILVRSSIEESLTTGLFALSVPMTEEEEGVQYRLETHGIPLTIVNIAATYSLNRELDLEALCSDLPNSEYNPERYSSLIFRSFGSTFLIPRSGKITLVGAKSKKQVVDSFQKFIKEFDNLGISCRFAPDKIQIQNIVAQGEFERNLDLTSLSVGLGFENTEYEPEQFPGLVYRDQDGVILFFTSGKFIITGISELAQVEVVANRVCEKLISIGLEII